MKRILYPFVVALALLCAFGAIAAANIATGTQGPWYVYVGAGTGSPLPTPYTSFDLCKEGARAMKIGKYVCKAQGPIVVAAAPVEPIWTKIADENGSFNVTANSTVRFGADMRWVQKVVSGSAACTNAAFGSDPAVGTLKQCEVANGSLIVPPADPTPVVDPPPVVVPAPSSLTASLVASRVSGTAPLAVHFDATGTTAAAGVDAFRDLTYAFDFGDERGESWSVSGKSKNSQTGGPLAAHVYDAPGTYTAKLAVAGAAASVQIVVADPSAVYAGTKTVCVSLTSDFTGCPGGAVQQKTIPQRGGWNGKRWLLHAGQDFTALGKLDIQDGDLGVQVGAFGAGAKPVVASVGVGDWRPNTTNFATDVSIIGLATKGRMAQNVGRRVLFYRNDLSGDAGFMFGDVGGWGAFDDTWRFTPKSAYSNPRELFFVENTSTGNTTTNGGNAFGWGARMAWMGNDFGVTMYHNLRVTQSFKSFFGHNRLRGNLSSPTYHVFKLHAGHMDDGSVPHAYDDSEIVSGPNWISRFNVIANNEFSSATDNAGWKTAFCPQNDQYLEPIEDLVVENNRYVVSATKGTDLLFGGKRMTARGNVRSDGSPAQTGTCHTGALPADRNGPYYFEK